MSEVHAPFWTWLSLWIRYINKSQTAQDERRVSSDSALPASSERSETRQHKVDIVILTLELERKLILVVHSTM